MLRTGSSISYSQLLLAVEQIQSNLTHFANFSEENVILCMENCIQYPIISLAVIKAQGVVFPLNLCSNSIESDLEILFLQSEPKVVFTQAQRFDLVERVRRKVDFVQVCDILLISV